MVDAGAVEDRAKLKLLPLLCGKSLSMNILDNCDLQYSWLSCFASSLYDVAEAEYSNS